jgi:hypothetical protein
MEVTDGPSRVEEFRKEIIHGRDLKVVTVSKQKFFDHLSGFMGVIVYERIYHKSNYRWLKAEDNYNDMCVNQSYLEDHGKNYAKYNVYHPDFAFPFLVYKQIEDMGNENNYKLFIVLGPQQSLPKELE